MEEQLRQAVDRLSTLQDENEDLKQTNTSMAAEVAAKADRKSVV